MTDETRPFGEADLSSLLGGLLDQAVHRGGRLCTDTHPVSQAVLRNAQAFFTAPGGGVVETQTLDETTIAAHALVGNDDVEERTAFGTAAGKSDDDHDLSFGWWTHALCAESSVRNVETRDMTTRPATRCKAANYIFVYRMPFIRASLDSDLIAMTAIYAHHVLHGTGTFEVEPPCCADMAARRAEVLARGLPWLVAEHQGQVAGFAYANWFKPRPAYRFSAEDSIYVADSARGQGLGRALLAALLQQAQAAGVRKMLAVIGDSANVGSIGVHRTLGFTEVGVMRSVGWKHGAWRDIVLMEKPLGAGDSTSPE